MQVTVTLFIQMCHFFMAWFLLHTFYFKPAIRILDAKQQELDALIAQEQQLRLYAQAKEQEISGYWRKLKHFSGQHAVEPAAPGGSERMQSFHDTFIAEQAQAEDSEQRAAVEADRAVLAATMERALLAEVLHVEL